MRIPAPASISFLLVGAVQALASQTPLGAQGFRYSGSVGFSSGSYSFAGRKEFLAFLKGVQGVAGSNPAVPTG